ncbi:zinc ribbon domain-containing protein [Polaromonas sp. P1(28)-13]|nr:zinc ribbon domain-containing protein [Polaromonas sp. P1(28)-13]
MPTYDYACAHCGPFAARRPLAAFDQPAPCPACGAESGRGLSVPASLGTRHRGARSGQATEQGGGSDYQRLRHGGDCACCPPARRAHA